VNFRKHARDVALLVMLSLAALLLHGYHFGVQDQAIYVPAIKKMLDPTLYPHDAQFFVSQTRWMLTDEIIAGAVRASGLSLEWVLLLFHVASVFVILLGCLRISRRCWASASGQWGAVLLATAVMSLVASASRIPMVDNHLHPRNLATGALLLAVPAALDRRFSALLGIAIAAVFHPLSAALACVHFAVLAWKPRQILPFIPLLLPPLLLASPMGDWLSVLHTYRNFYLWKWHGYEWLGVVAPLGFLFWFAHRPTGSVQQAGRSISGRIALSTSMFVLGAAVVSSFSALESLVILQPMRSLQLAFLFFFFFLGGWLGDCYLHKQPARWALLLVPACLGITYFQLSFYPATAYVEWPGRSTRNDWVDAFLWVRDNTPRDAYFAFDPLYMERSGEDWHGFRAWAERSHLADYTKDRAVTSLTPALAPEWIRQFRLLEKWQSFAAADFARLHRDEGVTWVLLENGTGPALDCPWHNARVRVCRTP